MCHDQKRVVRVSQMSTYIDNGKYQQKISFDRLEVKGKN